MRNGLPALMLALFSVIGTGCEEPPRPVRLPSGSEETVDDLRDRRRSGSTAETDSPAPRDDRQATGDRPAAGDREVRRRPDFRKRAARAAEEAEDDRDAEADLPTSARD